MSTTAIRSENSTAGTRVGQVDLKLEVITIPVADLDRLFLVVSDIQAARDELVRRGAEVSEVFHYAAGPGPFGGQVGGIAPDHQSYGSYGMFTDPDGNGWMLQEVTTRFPGRSRPPRRRSVRSAISRARSGGLRPLMGSMRSAQGSETRTGRPGTPRTWWRNRQAPNCLCERVAWATRSMSAQPR